MAKKIFGIVITIVLTMGYFTPAMANPIDDLRTFAEDNVPQLRDENFKREFTSADGIWNFTVKKDGDNYKIKGVAKGGDEELSNGTKLTKFRFTVEFESNEWTLDMQRDLEQNGVKI